MDGPSWRQRHFSVADDDIPSGFGSTHEVNDRSMWLLVEVAVDLAAERLAIADNRVGEIDLQWAVDVLQKFQANYPDILDGLFTEEDIEKIIRESKPEEELVSPEDMFDDFDPSRSKAGEKETMTSTFVFYGEQVDVISKALTTLGAAGLKERMLNLMNLPEV
jgi:hypothetical protein